MSRPNISSYLLIAQYMLLILLAVAPCAALATGEDSYPYRFFTRLAVTESISSSCTMPCATPVVENIEIYLHGGFSIHGDKVTGDGGIEVIPRSECMIVAEKSGGVGSSCRIAGPKNGSFKVDGYQSDVVRIAGQAFAPELTITLSLTVKPDLLVNFFLSFGGGTPQPAPVNHYQGSYQALLEQSGLVGAPFTVVAIQAENFVKDRVMDGLSRRFDARIELPAPGFVRTLEASGTFAFSRSPHKQ